MVNRVASVGRVIGGLMTLAALGGSVVAALAWGVAEGVSITLAALLGGLFLVALSLQSQIDSKTAIEFGYELTSVPLEDGRGIARFEGHEPGSPGYVHRVALRLHSDQTIAVVDLKAGVVGDGLVRRVPAHPE